MAASDLTAFDKPKPSDLDKCVHCGLCLNACPTYRELRVEMDSPRGRIYQMVQVSSGAAPISESYIEHIELCLACRGCETACPPASSTGAWWRRRARRSKPRSAPVASPLAAQPGVPATCCPRAPISHRRPPAVALSGVGLRRLLRVSGLCKSLEAARRAGSARSRRGDSFLLPLLRQVLPGRGQSASTAWPCLGGCIANISFARLHEATVRVLRKNGCEVSIPRVPDLLRRAACPRRAPRSGARAGAPQYRALLAGDYDAIITNASGCGSNLKEYGDLLEHDARVSARRRAVFRPDQGRQRVSGFHRAEPRMGPVAALPSPTRIPATWRTGKKSASAPRKLLAAVPGLKLREMPQSDICCGSAGIYNVSAHGHVHGPAATKNGSRGNSTGAGHRHCQSGLHVAAPRRARKFGSGQRVAHVVEILDEAYSNSLP